MVEEISGIGVIQPCLLYKKIQKKYGTLQIASEQKLRRKIFSPGPVAYNRLQLTPEVFYISKILLFFVFVPQSITKRINTFWDFLRRPLPQKYIIKIYGGQVFSGIKNSPEG